MTPSVDRKPKHLVSGTRLGAWLRPIDFELFDAYAKELQLDNAAVAALLVLRALRTEAQPTLPEASAPSTNARVRLTTSLRDINGRKSFRALAKRTGRSPEAALRALISLEISERWLERALRNQIDS